MNSDFCVGVHALVYLKRMKRVLSSEELADNICTNPARVRKVMAKLKKGGIIETHEGKEGGYRFSPEAAQTTLREIADLLDTQFVSANWHSGSLDKPCIVSSGMGAVMDDIFTELDEACRERLEHKTIRDIERLIVIKRKGARNNDCSG